MKIVKTIHHAHFLTDLCGKHVDNVAAACKSCIALENICWKYLKYPAYLLIIILVAII